jgi:hypothetical protein
LNLNEFMDALSGTEPPQHISLQLQALWYERKGDWDTAHKKAQEQDDVNGAWVHAYLHRVEGDLSNAAYWYRRAGKPVAKMSLLDEWEQLAAAFTL